MQIEASPSRSSRQLGWRNRMRAAWVMPRFSFGAAGRCRQPRKRPCDAQPFDSKLNQMAMLPRLDGKACRQVGDRPIGTGLVELLDAVGTGGNADHLDAGAVAGFDVARGIADGDRAFGLEGIAR